MVLALFAEERMKTPFMFYVSVTTPGVYEWLAKDLGTVGDN